MKIRNYNLPIILCSIIITFIITRPIKISAGEIQVDKSAPLSNQAGIDKASNLVPLVNIVSPSQRGVSHNKFDKFSVDQKGVILNNSLEVGKSVLGGIIYGNPNLQAGGKTARIVLNEVTGVTESKLYGVTEMFGDRAEYVLSNPNGIIVNGAGFINIPRVSLTTGNPIIEWGDLSRFDVEQGTILINENTFAGENIDYVELISRTARIESEIRAGKELSIKTGRNIYNYKDKKVEAKKENPQEKPIIAIDTSALGGMYSGRIYLIATEKGVGVNTEGKIGANIDDVTITANGEVVLKKEIAAKQNIKIKAAGEIKQIGDTLAEQKIEYNSERKIEISGRALSGLMTQINAADTITNKGTIATSRDLALQNLTGDDAIPHLHLKADIIENIGEIKAAGEIESESNSFINREGGLIKADGDISFITSDYIENNKADIISGGDIKLGGSENRNNERVTNRTGKIEAARDITIRTNKLENIGEDKPFFEDKKIHIKGTPDKVEFAGGSAEQIYIRNYPWNNWDVMYQYQVKSDITTTPGYLISGGTINIYDAETRNYGSLISAGGDIDFIRGSLKNETSAIELNFDNYQLFGKKSSVKKCNIFNSCKTRIEYSHYWSSGTAIAASANPAKIEAVRDIDISTAEVKNGYAGYQPISDKKKSEQIEREPVTISYNRAIFEKLKTKGIPIKYDPATTGLQTLSQFYGSNYFLNKIGYNPDRDTKTLILEPEYEARKIREAIFEATAQRYLQQEIISDPEQLRRLMDNAVKTGQNLQIRLGIELTPQQIKALDKDIYWLVEEEINGEKILVPRVYLSLSTIEKLKNRETTIKSGGKMTLAATGDIKNSGTITSGAGLTITAENIINQTIGDGERAKIIGAGAAELTAQQSITNISGEITSGDRLKLAATTGDITNQTIVNTSKYYGNIHSKAGQTASVKSGGDLIIDSGADIINTGADISALGNAEITAQKNIFINPITIRNYSATYFKKGHIIRDTTKNIGSNFDIYGSLTINAENLQITASDITARQDAIITAANDFSLKSAQDTDYFQSHIEQSRFLSSKATTTTLSSTKNIASNITAGNDLKITAPNRNINIIGSSITVRNNAQFTAGENFDLIAGYNTDIYDISAQKSGWFSGGAIYTKEKTATGAGSQRAVKSAITAKDLIITAGQNANIIGGDIKTDKTEIRTGADLTITSAPGRHYSYSYKEKTGFGLGGGLDFDKGRLSLTIAKGEYAKQKSRTDKTNQSSSEITANQNIDLKSDKDLQISGSNLHAGQDITLTAKQNIDIIPTQETTKTDTKTEKGEIELSLGIGNAYVDAAYTLADTAQAARAVEDARQQLEKIKELNRQGKAADNAVTDAEISLAAATANFGVAAIKASKAAADTAGSTSTSMGTGFYAALKLETETAETTTAEQTITNIRSSITAGKNLTITAGQEITQKGSITNAQTGDITYKAGQNLAITASRDKYNYKTASETKKASVTIGSTNPSAFITNDIGASLGYDKSSQNIDTTIYNNSSALAEQGAININTGANTEISGANLNAKEINAEIGGDLSVESLQDQYESYGRSNSFNIGYNTGTGAGLGAGYAKNNANSKWTNRQTSIIGTDSVNIEVKNNTELIGGVIANIDEQGEDTGNLQITTGALTYRDLRDYYTSHNSGASLRLDGLKIEKNDNDADYLTGDAQIKIENQGYDKEQITKATIGKGKITTADNRDTTDLNRDTTETQTVTKDTITAALNVETNFDLRLSSKSGREKITEEFKNLPQNLRQIGKGLRNNIVSRSIKNSTTDNDKNLIENINQYIADDRKITQIQEDEELTRTLNGLTNLDPLYLQHTLQNTADIAGDGEFTGDLHLYALINTGKGYAYTDAYGSTLGINTLKIDLTDSSEIINVLFHETTNHDDHSVNEQTAINRGDTGEAIWELKNFQKQNTNTITTEDWNKQNIDNPVILYGTSTAYNDNIKASTNPNAEINNFFTPDTLLDLGFIGYDLYEILIDNILGDQNNLKENLITLGGDTAGFFIPVATGLGTAAKTANKIDNAINLTAKSDKVVKYGDEINNRGVTIFRQGTFGDKTYSWGGNYIKGKQWASDNPLITKDYAKKYGLPSENTGKPDWIVKGNIDINYKTRPAPASHNNLTNTGGGIEIIPNNPDKIKLDWFYMPE